MIGLDTHVVEGVFNCFHLTVGTILIDLHERERNDNFPPRKGKELNEMVCNRQRCFNLGANCAITKLKGRLSALQRILRRERQSGNALFVANQNQKMGRSLKFVRVLDVAEVEESNI
jgi:hypothetical protein